jgi:thiol:disulfide interchange protein DsbA
MRKTMFRTLAVLVLLPLSFVACAREAPAPSASTPAATTAAPPTTQTAPTAQNETQQATAAQESTGETSAEDRGDASLERLAALPAEQQLPGGRWKAGVNYTPLVPSQPTSVASGKVEVVEVFWYACGHCYALEPYLQSWLKNKAEYIQFVRVPVMWGPVHRAHAHLYYTLQALGRNDLDQTVFDTIHQKGNMLVSNDEQRTRQMQLDFAKANGITEEQFNKAYDSFTVNSSLQRAEQLTQRYRVQGVPLIVVNGKYTTDVGMAGGHSELLALINDLAASEKRR